jgi:beta-1,4-N-acetylglucosaminyltransferase
VTPPKLLLVCSPGGHLQEMVALEPAFRGLTRTWVTTPKADVEAQLAQEEYRLAHGPTNRNVPNLLRNFVVAWRILRTEDPDVVLSTGAALAIPFFVLGKLQGRRLVYVESLARVEALSLTGRLLYPIADQFFVQSPRLARLRRARYEGSVL